MKTSEAINELAAAMVKAQAHMPPAIKDATNPAYRAKYADLSAVWAACREPLTANGITVWQDVTTEVQGISVTTRLTHITGQWVEFGPLTIPMGKQDAHGVGSATSYGKRYSLAAAVGVVSEDDDDGNAASPKSGRAVSGASTPSVPPTSTAPPSGPPRAGGREAAPTNGAQTVESVLVRARELGWKDAELSSRARKEFRKGLAALTQAELHRLGDIIETGEDVQA